MNDLEVVPPAYTSAVVGDRIHLLDADATHVAGRCTITPPLAAREYACLPCRQRLANWHQLEAHVETAAGLHTIARLCPQHGWESL